MFLGKTANIPSHLPPSPNCFFAGGRDMALETKVLLVAIGNIVKLSKDPKAIYKAIEGMANVEGIKLEPYEDKEEESGK